MAEVKLELNRLSRPEKVALAQAIEKAMTGNAAFPDPDPALSELLADYMALKAGLETQTAAKVAYHAATAALQPLTAKLDGTLTLLGKYVQLKSGGQARIILSANMGVRDAGAPIHLAKVTGLEATAGMDAQKAKLVWDRLPKATGYEGQWCGGPVTPDGWLHLGHTMRRKFTATGLPSGMICWFRFRALGANDPGAWSDPAMVMIP